MTYSNYLENKIIDKVFRGVDFTVPGVFVKLHVGDPGEDGSANAAAETTRKAATFGAAASGTNATTADINWTSVTATEEYTHVSLWDTVGPSGGNPLSSGPLGTPRPVQTGDNFKIPAGQLQSYLD